MRTNDTRRGFLKLVGATVLTVPLARLARADDLPHVAESDPTATALGYKEDAGKVDAAKFPQHKAGNVCANCQFFGGSGAYGPCQLFPGKAVNAKGWCSAYAAKA
jgi:hypothetical protein